MKRVVQLKGTLFSIALAMLALSIAYCPADDDKKPQDVAEAKIFSLIPPSFVKTTQNGANLW